MLGLGCFDIISVKGAECKKLVVWRPTIADNRGIVVGKDLKNVSAIRVDRPEMPITQKSNFVASDMARATAHKSGSKEQEEQKYENMLAFHDGTIAL